MMLIAILILLCVSLFLNLVLGVFLVRFRESVDQREFVLNAKIDRLTKEILLRLPRRPYGVDIEDREPTLPMGPIEPMGPIDAHIGQ